MAADGQAFEDILFEIDGPVATISLNRPSARNAWTLGMGAEVEQALAMCHSDDRVRAVIVCGVGDRDFCVGADLSGRDIAAPGGQPTGKTRPELSPPSVCKPVIAAMNGNAVGIGTTYPLLCDIRIVAEDAKVGLPFVRRGVMGEANSHWILQRLVGFATAAELLLSGRLISGAEAAAMGLCSQALPGPEVVPAARSLALEIAANTAPLSVAASKQMLWEALDLPRGQAAARESQLFMWLAGQRDATEGVASFLEHRPPAWTLSASTPLPAPDSSQSDGT